RAVELGLEVTGLSLAQRLRPFLGKWLALRVALVIGGVRLARQRKRGLSYDLKGAIAAFCGIVPATLGVRAVCFDTESLERLQAKLAPLALFGSSSIVAFMHDLVETQLLSLLGREREAVERFEKVVER